MNVKEFSLINLLTIKTKIKFLTIYKIFLLNASHNLILKFSKNSIKTNQCFSLIIYKKIKKMKKVLLKYMLLENMKLFLISID